MHQVIRRSREVRKSDVPEEGFKTRRNRSTSPSSKTSYANTRPLSSATTTSSRNLNSDREVVVRRDFDGDRTGRRIVSKEDGTIKIQVKDARELLSRRHEEVPPFQPEINFVRDYRQRSEFDPNKMEIDQEAEEHQLRPTSELPVKCAFFPNCRSGDACPYYHPTRPCVFFPNCSHADRCTFIHPSIPCKYQASCTKPLCNYTHTKSTASMILCKFYPNCVNANCPFVHPIETPCKFGLACQNASCPFKHPEGRSLTAKAKIFSPCIYGRACAKPGCPYQHPPPAESSSPTDPSALPTPSPVPPESQMIAEPVSAVAIDNSRQYTN